MSNKGKQETVVVLDAAAQKARQDAAREVMRAVYADMQAGRLPYADGSKRVAEALDGVIWPIGPGLSVVCRAGEAKDGTVTLKADLDISDPTLFDVPSFLTLGVKVSGLPAMLASKARAPSDKMQRKITAFGSDLVRASTFAVEEAAKEAAPVVNADAQVSAN